MKDEVLMSEHEGWSKKKKETEGSVKEWKWKKNY